MHRRTVPMAISICDAGKTAVRSMPMDNDRPTVAIGIGHDLHHIVIHEPLPNGRTQSRASFSVKCTSVVSSARAAQ